MRDPHPSWHNSPRNVFLLQKCILGFDFFFMLIYLILKSAPPTQGSFQFNLNVSSRRHGRPRAVPGAPGMHESHSTTWVTWEGKWVVCCQALQIHKPQRSWGSGDGHLAAHGESPLGSMKDRFEPKSVCGPVFCSSEKVELLGGDHEGTHRAGNCRLGCIRSWLIV